MSTPNAIKVKCSHCGTEWELDAPDIAMPRFQCTECGTSFDIAAASFYESEASLALVLSRYGKSYQVAQTARLVGRIIKILSLILSGLGFIATIITAYETRDLPQLQSRLVFAGVITAAVTAAFGFGFGILVETTGQILFVSTDAAVCVNPLISRADVKGFLEEQ